MEEVRRCGIDTSVPGVYNVTFSVFNSAGLAAESLNRSVVVTATCPPGEHVCANLVDCSNQSFCEGDLQDVLTPSTVVDTPPNITLVTSNVLGPGLLVQ